MGGRPAPFLYFARFPFLRVFFYPSLPLVLLSLFCVNGLAPALPSKGFSSRFVEILHLSLFVVPTFPNQHLTVAAPVWMTNEIRPPQINRGAVAQGTSLHSYMLLFLLPFTSRFFFRFLWLFFAVGVPSSSATRFYRRAGVVRAGLTVWGASGSVEYSLGDAACGV